MMHGPLNVKVEALLVCHIGGKGQ